MLAERVKEAARRDLRALAEEAGFRLARGKTYHCALHRDRTPSAHLYEDAIYCFSCTENFDAIDLAHLITGGSAGQAIQWLAARYGIVRALQTSRRKPFRNTDLTDAELFRVGFCWVIERQLTELKRPLLEGGLINARQISRRTSLLNRLKTWSDYRVGAFFFKVKARLPEFAQECVQEAEEFQVQLATVIANVDTRKAITA